MDDIKECAFNVIELAVFSGRLNSICEEMGGVLQKSALSPNIKDRMDFSCAFFDSRGRIMAQAAHIPVHLGSMAFAMSDIVTRFLWNEGDVLVLNDPFMGGTHLPDVTLISPVFINHQLLGFVANRAHHANIGCETSGSMPLSKSLSEEGVVIKPVKLYERGRLKKEVVTLLASVDKFADQHCLPGDFLAQVSANVIGIKRMLDWVEGQSYTVKYFQQGLVKLNQYGRDLALKSFSKLPRGKASFKDYMDGDGYSCEPIVIELSLSIHDNEIYLDFTGTSQQVGGNINCPLSVCVAAVYYAFAGLLPDYTPHCYGVFDIINVKAPLGTLVNATEGAAVSAGNVETSMRLVDVVLGALSKLGVDVPAASQGTMNNIAMGGVQEDVRWDYYETIGGGGGAGSSWAGLNAVQCHMTNTLNTPVESLEMHYPLRIKKYAVRSNSGGRGLNVGGDGIERVYEFLIPLDVTVLTERRCFKPWGLNGGQGGDMGVNLLNDEVVANKVSMNASKGDVLRILTPGGGGWGNENLE